MSDDWDHVPAGDARVGTGRIRGIYNRNASRYARPNNGSHRDDDRPTTSQYGNSRNGGSNRSGNEVLYVPSRFVGRIIGRGGSRINQLRIESGARIHVTKDTDGENTVIKLFGNPIALKKAINLIKDLTDTIEFMEAEDMPKNIPNEPPQEELLDWNTFLKGCYVREEPHEMEERHGARKEKKGSSRGGRGRGRGRKFGGRRW